MYYMDTSVVVAYYCPEPLSEIAEAFLMTHGHPAVSSLTEVEFFSALSRKVREAEMNRRDANRVKAKFFSHLDGGFYTHFPLRSHHYSLARDWIGLFNTKLKTRDAMHLAIASSEGLTLVTADQDLHESAKALAQEILLLKPSK